MLRRSVVMASLSVALWLMAFPTVLRGRVPAGDPAPAGTASAWGEVRALPLAVGEATLVDLPFEVGLVHLTDPRFFDYQRLGSGERRRKLEIIARRPGAARLTIHDAAGRPRRTYLVDIVPKEETLSARR